MWGERDMPGYLSQDALMFFDRKPGALALYEALAARLLALFADTVIRVGKTQISFFDGHMYCCASLAPVLPKARRPDPFLTVSFVSREALDSPRAIAVPTGPNRFTHHVIIGSADEIDDELTLWLEAAHELAARPNRRI